jgi:hypothetical protein
MTQDLAADALARVPREIDLTTEARRFEAHGVRGRLVLTF